MKRAAGPLLAVLALAGALAASEVGRRRAQSARAAAAAAGAAVEIRHAPSAAALRVMSLNEKGLAADFLMLRTIAYFANPRAREKRYPWLAGLLGTITELDPKWRDAYLYGAYFLSGEPGAGDEQARKDKKRARKLLERGMRERPRDPELVIHAARIYLAPPAPDVEGAARFFRRALELPGAHRGWIPDVLRGIESESGQWHALERMFKRELDRLASASSSADRSLRRHFRRQYIECAAMARRDEIKAALLRFLAERGAPPRHIEDLVAARTIARVPVEPFGTEWELERDLAAKRVEVTSRGLRILRYNRFVNYVRKLLAGERPDSFRAAHKGRPPDTLEELVLFFRGKAEADFREKQGRPPRDAAELVAFARIAGEEPKGHLWKSLLKHFPGLELPPHPLGGVYRYNSNKGEILVEEAFTLERLFGETP